MKTKTITLVGSMRFSNHFQSIASRIEKWHLYTADAWVILYPIIDERGLNKEELMDIHRHKIDRADSIIVVDVDGYVGESTREEITYALTRGKKVESWLLITKGGCCCDRDMQTCLGCEFRKSYQKKWKRLLVECSNQETT